MRRITFPFVILPHVVAAIGLRLTLLREGVLSSTAASPSPKLSGVVSVVLTAAFHDFSLVVSPRRSVWSGAVLASVRSGRPTAGTSTVISDGYSLVSTNKNRSFVWWWLMSLAVFACSPAVVNAPPTEPSVHLTTERVIVTPDAARGVSGWFERGRAHYEAGRFRAGLSDFDRVLANDLEEVWSDDALFYTGLAYEALEDFRRAAAAHESLGRRFPQSEYAREALVRAVRLLGYLEEWSRAGDLASSLSAERDLTPREAIVVYSAKALGVLVAIESRSAIGANQSSTPVTLESVPTSRSKADQRTPQESRKRLPLGAARVDEALPTTDSSSATGQNRTTSSRVTREYNQLQTAESWIVKGRRIVDRYRLDSAGTIPRDLAQLFFAVGELRRLRGERLTFDPFPSDFAARFEQRAQLLLDAQSAYSDVMRARDSHWTAMAGFRVGELYTRLHRDVITMPRPPTADTQRRRELLEAAIRVRYAVLLRKGLGMYDHILSMAARTGENSSWISRTRRARSELQVALQQEEEALQATEYSRLEIERALDAMRR